MGGRDEPYLVQVKLVGGFARHRQMSVMDGIKGAAEKGQSHDLVFRQIHFHRDLFSLAHRRGHASRRALYRSAEMVL